LDETREAWFSAEIRLVGYVGRSARYFRDTVFLFRAREWKEAQERAISLGRSREEEYLNGESVQVHWRLKEIVTLDLIGNDDLNGAEVHSQLLPVGDVSVPPEDELNPEQSEPTQTI
jgi:hypothetical protein